MMTTTTGKQGQKKSLHAVRFTSEDQVSAAMDKKAKEGYSALGLTVNNACVWIVFASGKEEKVEHACARCTNERQLTAFLQKKEKEGYRLLSLSSNDTYVWCIMQRQIA